MVEIMHMKHRMSTDTAFIKGLVMDHGARHDGMPKRIDHTYILTLNVSLKYERSELGANFFYNDPSKKDAMERSLSSSAVSRRTSSSSTRRASTEEALGRHLRHGGESSPSGGRIIGGTVGHCQMLTPH
eukprot:PhM_4_TR12445/c0_g1_i1/m.83254/K09498/CCT6; T-complex protein 1 subunit zeta